MTSEDLLERCRRAVANGRRHGANAVEVFGQTVESVNATVEKHDLQISKSQIETSFGVRAFVSKRVGFASTNAPSRIDAICQEAITLAAASPEDPHNVLPKSVETEPIDGLYDPAAASFEATDAVHRTAEILDRVEAIDRRVIVNDAWFEAQRAEIAVANSEGLAVRELGSLFTYGLVATARDRERVSSFDVQSDASRTVAGISAEPFFLRPEPSPILSSARSSSSSTPGTCFGVGADGRTSLDGRSPRRLYRWSTTGGSPAASRPRPSTGRASLTGRPRCSRTAWPPRCFTTRTPPVHWGSRTPGMRQDRPARSRRSDRRISRSFQESPRSKT